MKAPRGLSAEEAELWARLARTVTPLKSRQLPRAPLRPKEIAAPVETFSPPESVNPSSKKLRGRVPPARVIAPPPAAAPAAAAGLDSHWERRLDKASMDPDFTLDLHGHTLDQAHRRLDMGLTQAKMMGARLVLLITGKSRPVEAADRGERRGAIRAKVIDWLAAGPHSSDIVAVRKAHRRHGGEGALYLVLKRRR